jgi:pumilio family protein 6
VSGLDDITQSVFGRKVLHYLLSPRDRHFFHPDIIGILQQGDSNAHSKKEASVRWSELKDAISPALLAYVAQNAKEMLCDKPSSLLLQSVLENATGELNEAMEAVAMVAGEEFDSQSHVVCDPCGHLALKKLIQHDASRQGPPYFSEILVSKLHDNSVTQWMSINRGAFVIASLLECPVTGVSTAIKTGLERDRRRLKHLDTPGASVVNKLLGNKA